MVFIVDCKVNASPTLLLTNFNIPVINKINQLNPISNKPLQMCFYLK